MIENIWDCSHWEFEESMDKSYSLLVCFWISQVERKLFSWMREFWLLNVTNSTISCTLINQDLNQNFNTTYPPGEPFKLLISYLVRHQKPLVFIRPYGFQTHLTFIRSVFIQQLFKVGTPFLIFCRHLHPLRITSKHSHEYLYGHMINYV